MSLAAALLSSGGEVGAATDAGERVELERVAAGLPRSGQWRNGFDLADMDHDGRLDLVHGPPRDKPGPPAIFLGRGDARFILWKDAAFPDLAYSYGDAEAADFDGDGLTDLALAMHLEGVVVLYGDGRGAFQLEPVKDSKRLIPDDSFSSRALTAVDWNRDGLLDLAAMGEGPKPRAVGTDPLGRSGGSFGLQLYLNQGERYAWQKDLDPVERPTFADSLVVGDFNGDGWPDLATGTHRVGHRGLVQLGGPASQRRPIDVTGLPRSSLVYAIASGKIDDDSKDDLVIGYWLSNERESNGIVVLLARSNDGWQVGSVVEGPKCQGLAAGRLNRDAHLDVVAVTTEGSIRVFLGEGNGRLQETEGRGSRKAGDGCRGSGVRLADLDGDGVDEIFASFADEASSCASGGSLQLWRVANPS